MCSQKINDGLELISIIIPVYNAEKYIENCIISLINQTYKNIEIILVDDKSSDNSLRIIKDYLYDERIRIIRKDVNSGVSNTRNIGLENAIGNYIMFVDADDYVSSDYIENMYQLLIKNQADIVCSNFKKVNNFNEKLTTENMEINNILFYEEEIKNIVQSMLNNKKYKVSPDIFGFSCGKLYTKNVIRNVEFNEKIRFREDTLFNIQVYQQAEKIVYCNANFYFYFVNEESASFRFFDNYETEIECFFYELKSIYTDNKAINICGLFMYMNYLKHYAMHQDCTEKSSYKLIRDTFDKKIWREFFYNVDYRYLAFPYKVLVCFFRYRITFGIILLFKINELLKRQ